MDQRTVHAIVLRRRDAGESDRRLTLLTAEEGKIQVVAKGARKGGSRLAGSSEPLMASVMALAPGRRQAFITQSQPQSSFPGLRTDYDRLSFGLALAELYEAILPEQEPFPEAYDLLLRSLLSLERHEKAEVAFVWAQIALMRLAGFLPQWDSCVHTGVPVAEALPFVSPTAGGYVVASHVMVLHDRVQTRAEVLFGLSRLADLDSPPPALKFARESIVLLTHFWGHIADKPLPALESVRQEQT